MPEVCSPPTQLVVNSLTDVVALPLVQSFSDHAVSEITVKRAYDPASMKPAVSTDRRGPSNPYGTCVAFALPVVSFRRKELVYLEP